jgi:hypothetical protein
MPPIEAKLKTRRVGKIGLARHRAWLVINPIPVDIVERGVAIVLKIVI